VESRSTRKAAQATPSSAATLLNTTLKSLLDQSIGQQSNDEQGAEYMADGSVRVSGKPPGDDKKTQPDDNNNKDDDGSGEGNSGGDNIVARVLAKIGKFLMEKITKTMTTIVTT